MREGNDTSIEGAGTPRSSKPTPLHFDTTSGPQGIEQADPNSHRTSGVQDNVCQLRSDKAQEKHWSPDAQAHRLLSDVVHHQMAMFLRQADRAAEHPPTIAPQMKVSRE